MAQPGSNFGTSVTGHEFQKTTLKSFHRKSWLVDVVNRDFHTPGNDDPKSTKSIKEKNQKFTVTSILSNGWDSYSGSDITYAEAKEVISTLTIDQFLKISETIPSLSAFKSSVSDPNSALMASQAEKLRVKLQKAFLALYADAGAGNWLGTPYTTGTVEIAVTTGVVTGTTTVFTAAMVGKPFRAAGHTKWYRVKSRASNTEIVIENDSDDETSSYDGGAISAGATYEIQANAAIALTKSNIAQYLSSASQLLDNASYAENDEMSVPTEGRFFILPATAKSALVSASEFNRDIEMVYNETVKEGKVGRAYGFDIYTAKTAWMTSDGAGGFYCPYGHKNWATMGMGFIDPVNVILSKDNQTNFGDKIKGLFGYGFKVADPRRFMGGVLRASF